MVMGANQKRYDLILVVFFFLSAIILEYREAFSLLEDQLLSYRQILRTHYGDEFFTSPSEDVVIVFTDEEFYENYDKFPLRRVDLSTIIVRLKEMGASVIGVDMLLDFNSAYGEDPTLQDALEEAGNVLLVSAAEIDDSGEFKGLNTAIERFDEVTVNGYSNIASNSAISETITRLGIHPEMVDKYDAWPFIVMSAALYLEEEPYLEDGDLVIGDTRVRLDQNSEMYIDYPLLPASGELTADLHDVIGISASDLLFVDDEEELEDLAYLVDGKIVLIGEVAEVAHDVFETPTGKVFGVEVIANGVTTILRGGPLKPASFLVESIIALLLLAFFVWTRAVPSPMTRNSITAGVMLLYIIACTTAYISSGLIISMSYILLAALFSVVAINAKFYIAEMGQKAMIREMFGQYLSPRVVADLENDPEKVSLGGEEREMTAFFSDIRGFSSISENMSPTELVSVLNEYLTEMCNIIIGLGGTIDKFEGDAIVAFWGAPVVQPDHPKLACFACIDMQKALVRLRERWAKEGIPEIHVRMGVNSGPMVVGNMGSAQRVSYTIMGDSVNLASRLEGANKAYGSRTMISEDTYKQVVEDVDVRELDTIRVVGKSEPTRVYELLDRKNQTPAAIADMVDKYNDGLELYKNGYFAEAKVAFERCLSLYPDDGPTATYVARCEEFVASPPGDDWDGVHTLTDKG